MSNEKKRLFHDVVPPADPNEAEDIYMLENKITGEVYIRRAKSVTGEILSMNKIELGPNVTTRWRSQQKCANVNKQ